MKNLFIFSLVVLTVATVHAQETPTLQSGEVKHDNGKPKFSYQYYMNDEGEEVRHGPFTLWYENGQKKATGEFKHGQPTGLLTRWYENGQKLAEVEEDGNQGKEFQWYESGQKKSVTIYKGQDFERTAWYPTGTKKADVRLVNGTGQGRSWYANGQLQTLANIEDGKPHGGVQCWDCKGRLLAQGKHKHGKRDTGGFVRWGDDDKMAVIETMQYNGTWKQVHVVPQYDEKADRPRVRDKHVSDDPDYGYTKENPVKLGGGELGILAAARAERRFLRHLRTPAMVPLDFFRIGSVGAIRCGDTTHVIDAYSVVSRDGTFAKTIYIDMYHNDIDPLDALAPQGLLLLTAEKK
jgi:antitoxin component YwqK of YwqJK toxin-antitoxin module